MGCAIMCILSWLLYTLLPDAATFSGLAYRPNFWGHHKGMVRAGIRHRGSCITLKDICGNALEANLHILGLSTRFLQFSLLLDDCM